MKVLITIICLTIVSFANIFDFKSYEANFKQTILNSSQQEILYKGKLYLKDNGNVLWQYNNPIIKNVYINNESIIIDEPELEQAIISKISSDLNMHTILKQSFKIDDNTYENTIGDIKYTIKLQEDKLRAIFYTDNIGNKIKIVFTEVKINKTIDDEIFKFKAPSNYDIIRK